MSRSKFTYYEIKNIIIVNLGFEAKRDRGLINKKTINVNTLIVFCRGGRIRTCDPLVPNQMR